MMKLLRSLLLLAMLSAPAWAQNSVDPILTKEYPSLEELYKTLHSNPELSKHEVNTSARVAEELRKLGFEVTEKFGKFEDPKITSYGIVAVMKNGPGKTVYVRTDLDALPIQEKTNLPYASKVTTKNDEGQDVSVMHACGHDIHMTVLVGTARVLAAMKKQWKGTLVLIGQPSEERGPGGAEALLRDGLYTKFPKPDYVLALHDNSFMPAGTVGWAEGYVLSAADSVDITIRGVGGHGSAPDKAKDPIVIAAQLILALQTIVSREVPPSEPSVITVGSIQGGTKNNIIPDEVKLKLTVRSYKKEVREILLNGIQRITKGIAQAAGVPADREPLIDLHPEEYYPSTYNNPDLAHRTVPALEAALGKDHVVKTDPIMASEDFSFYSLPDHSVPAFMFWLGAVDPQRVASGEKLPSLHSSLFAPVPEPTIKTGVKAMSAAVMNLLK
jgi:hippurate hydrolase